MLPNWLRRFFAKDAKVAPVPSDKPAKPAGVNIRLDALAMMYGSDGEPVNPYKLPEVAPGVIPRAAKIACDQAIGDQYIFAAQQDSAYSEGVAFVGFSTLAALTQRSEYRRPSELIAKEMTRKWIKLQAVGEGDKSEKLHAIEAEFKRLGVQAAFCKAAEQDGFYGRSQIYLDTGDTLRPDELSKPLVDNVSKISIGKLKAIRVIEPIWTYPNRYNADNPLREDYYKPQSWFVMGQEIHDSRLLTFISRQTPDILKPAYAFSGLSLTQILMPYVNNWLRTRQSVSDILHSFSVFVLETDMSSILNGGAGVAEQARFELFNTVRDNSGILAINKDTEAFKNVAVPLGSLDHLQSQAQEHQASCTGIPLTVMFGITPSGLNASSASDLDIFYSWISSQQTNLFTPPLSRLLNIVQLSLFGEIDPDIGFRWEPLRALDESQVVDARRTEAETDCMLIDHAVITPAEARGRVANQFESAYHGLDVHDAPDELPDTDEPFDNDERNNPPADPSKRGD